MLKVCINPGHAPNGNPDPGAVGQTGLKESDVACDIGQLVMYYLQQVNYDVEVIQNDNLQTICDYSNNFGADLFVSIHCNAANDRSVKGTETWYCDGSIKGEFLARSIQNQITESMGTVNRGVKDAVPHKNGLYVLTNTDAIAVLVECAFISNSDDESILDNETTQDGFARAIARGITDYFK